MPELIDLASALREAYKGNDEALIDNLIGQAIDKIAAAGGIDVNYGDIELRGHNT